MEGLASHLKIAFAVFCKLVVVLFTVQLYTDETEYMKQVAKDEIVIPRIAMSAKRKTNLHGGPSEEAKCLPNIERVIDEHLHPRAHLHA